MAQVLIRDLPDEVVKRLKKRAAARGISLQAELRRIVIDAARTDLETVRVLAARLRKRLALKGRQYSDSVDLIREDRDR